LKLIRSERAAGDSSMGIEIIPKVRNPFHDAATVRLHRMPAGLNSSSTEILCNIFQIRNQEIAVCRQR
jgi:hypothetical protein